MILNRLRDNMATKTYSSDAMGEAVQKMINDGSLTPKEKSALRKLQSFMKSSNSPEELIEIYRLPVFKKDNESLSNYDALMLLRQGNMQQGMINNKVILQIDQCIELIQSRRERVASERSGN
jgi:hypothetical protein